MTAYKEVCNLCKGNGYITLEVNGKDEVKQCWLCESEGEHRYSQAEVDKFIYETYYKAKREKNSRMVLQGRKGGRPRLYDGI